MPLHTVCFSHLNLSKSRYSNSKQSKGEDYHRSDINLRGRRGPWLCTPPLPLLHLDFRTPCRLESWQINLPHLETRHFAIWPEVSGVNCDGCLCICMQIHLHTIYSINITVYKQSSAYTHMNHMMTYAGALWVSWPLFYYIYIYILFLLDFSWHLSLFPFYQGLLGFLFGI